MIDRALIDSNVLIAAIIRDHVHHGASVRVLTANLNFAVAGHSFAESYRVLTRRGGPLPFALSASICWAALNSIRAKTELVGISPLATVEAIRRFSEAGGIGARLYDYLIGEAAIATNISTIVTWNTRDFRALFPHLKIVTPTELLA